MDKRIGEVTRGILYGAMTGVFLCYVILGVGCCPPSHVDADAIGPGLEKVLNRHDAYVQQDLSKDPAKRASELRTSELLRETVNEARSGQ